MMAATRDAVEAVRLALACMCELNHLRTDVEHSEKAARLTSMFNEASNGLEDLMGDMESHISVTAGLLDVPNKATDVAICRLMLMAESATRYAVNNSLVLNISQVSRLPLAMGNHANELTIRPARKRAPEANLIIGAPYVLTSCISGALVSPSNQY